MSKIREGAIIQYVESVFTGTNWKNLLRERLRVTRPANEPGDWMAVRLEDPDEREWLVSRRQIAAGAYIVVKTAGPEGEEEV